MVRPVARNLPLDRGAVHVWTTDIAHRDPAELAQVLSPDERRRAAGYRLDSARDRFIVRRGLLRRLMARYLDVRPDTIEFATTCRHCAHPAHGKPTIAWRGERAPLDFSVSGSASAVLYAVSATIEVGADVEAIRPGLNLEGLAAACLAPREQAALARLPSEEHAGAFCAAWATKEAHLKTLGWGLAVELRQIEVEVDPSKPAALLGSPLGSDQFVRRLRCGPGLAAVVAGLSAPTALIEYRLSD